MIELIRLGGSDTWIPANVESAQWLENQTRIKLSAEHQKRTTKQNNSLHKYLQQVEAECKERGLDARKFFRPEVEIPITAAMLKNDAWRPIQRAMFDIESTTDLSTTQMQQVYEVFARHLAQSHDIAIEWPCRETQIMEAIG